MLSPLNGSLLILSKNSIKFLLANYIYLKMYSLILQIYKYYPQQIYKLYNKKLFHSLHNHIPIYAHLRQSAIFLQLIYTFFNNSIFLLSIFFVHLTTKISTFHDMKIKVVLTVFYSPHQFQETTP